MERIYKIGTRTSPLALRQVEEALGALRGLHLFLKAEVIGIDTCGDRDKDTPISQAEGTDFFTREIDAALLQDKIDFAVHSAKDLPGRLKDGLIIAAVTKSIEPHDALASRAGLKLSELPCGAKIGTSSLRRKEGLKKFRPDFQIVNIRGNIEERLKLLDDTERRTANNKQQSIDAVVIAAAGLIRLGLEDRIIQRIPFEILKPHPLQGRLALIVKTDDLELINLLSLIDSREGVFS